MRIKYQPTVPNSLNSSLSNKGEVVNSNSGGVTYWNQINDIIYVTMHIPSLLYDWKGEAIITKSALPKPEHKIAFHIVRFETGESIPCYLNTDGMIVNGAQIIVKSDLPYSASFSYKIKDYI